MTYQSYSLLKTALYNRIIDLCNGHDNQKAMSVLTSLLGNMISNEDNPLLMLERMKVALDTIVHASMNKGNKSE